MKLLTLMAISFGFLTAAYSSSAVSVGCMTEEATVFASELSGQSFAVIVPASAIQEISEESEDDDEDLNTDSFGEDENPILPRAFTASSDSTGAFDVLTSELTSVSCTRLFKPPKTA